MNYSYKPHYLPGYHPAMGKYALGPQAGPQSVVIRQVIGANRTETVVEVPVRIPPQHPAIEQIIDVLVRRLRLTRVESAFNQVIVCGDFEVKALYVACLPNQPVHAVEVRWVKFAAAVPIQGAYWGMDAEARAVPVYVDYDCDPSSLAYWHKQNQYSVSGDAAYSRPVAGQGAAGWGLPAQGYCDRFNVTVVLQIDAKVMADREVMIYPGAYPGLPPVPKG
ncbi:MAG: hypothetical protein P4N41_25695 [Negativicutes bacterium]|nr:hypothetical protein [Negativicutes bacterium]